MLNIREFSSVLRDEPHEGYSEVKMYAKYKLDNRFLHLRPSIWLPTEAALSLAPKTELDYDEDVTLVVIFNTAFGSKPNADGLTTFKTKANVSREFYEALLKGNFATLSRIAGTQSELSALLSEQVPEQYEFSSAQSEFSSVPKRAKFSNPEFSSRKYRQSKNR